MLLYKSVPVRVAAVVVGGARCRTLGQVSALNICWQSMVVLGQMSPRDYISITIYIYREREVESFRIKKILKKEESRMPCQSSYGLTEKTFVTNMTVGVYNCTLL